MGIEHSQEDRLMAHAMPGDDPTWGEVSAFMEAVDSAYAEVPTTPYETAHLAAVFGAARSIHNGIPATRRKTMKDRFTNSSHRVLIASVAAALLALTPVSAQPARSAAGRGEPASAAPARSALGRATPDTDATRRRPSRGRVRRPGRGRGRVHAKATATATHDDDSEKASKPTKSHDSEESDDKAEKSDDDGDDSEAEEPDDQGEDQEDASDSHDGSHEDDGDDDGHDDDSED